MTLPSWFMFLVGALAGALIMTLLYVPLMLWVGWPRKTDSLEDTVKGKWRDEVGRCEESIEALYRYRAELIACARREKKRGNSP